MAGRKRRFLLFGVVNVLLTNGALLLLLHLVTIGLATFLSQLLNGVLGYWLYGKQVFRVERFAWRSAGAYGGLAAAIWLLNWLGIRLLAGAGLPRTWAAVAMIPLLAALSYGVQKTLVFRPDPALQSVAAASAPDPAVGMGQRL
jgi:putative flippase GtrA